MGGEEPHLNPLQKRGPEKFFISLSFGEGRGEAPNTTDYHTDISPYVFVLHARKVNS
jgi:hypothetical protein